LIDLADLKEIPAGFDAIIVNSLSPNLGDESSLQSAGSTPIIRLRYRPSFPINHYSVRYQDNFQLDDFQEVAKWLDQNRGLRKSLFALKQSAPDQPTGQERFEWSADGQTVNFTGLKPGLPYLFNFSYFPYWQAMEAQSTADQPRG
jgi:hypothetical protein